MDQQNGEDKSLWNKISNFANENRLTTFFVVTGAVCLIAVPTFLFVGKQFIGEGASELVKVIFTAAGSSGLIAKGASKLQKESIKSKIKKPKDYSSEENKIIQELQQINNCQEIEVYDCKDSGPDLYQTNDGKFVYGFYSRGKIKKDGEEFEVTEMSTSSDQTKKPLNVCKDPKKAKAAIKLRESRKRTNRKNIEDLNFMNV